MSFTLPAVNIQFPISRSIFDGSKVIETRTYDLPKQYLGKEIFLMETPGKSKDFSARIIAVIKVKQSFKYNNKQEFYADFKKHLVDKNSPWAWVDAKGKWGWEVEVIRRFKSPPKFSGKRGIVFSKSITIKEIKQPS